MNTTICIIQKTFTDGRQGHRMELNGNTVIPLSHAQFAELKANLNLKDATETNEHKGEKEELWY